MSDTFAIELKGVTKVFGQIVANKDVNLQVKKGEILAILGENGSGKTTLMNMLSGIYFPDEGQIYVNGEEVVIKSPRDAFKYGIGMVHQHFKLVDVFTATENIVLGINDKEKFNIKKAEKKVKEITDKYGFDINLESKVYEMSVSEKQTVEIVKVLYRGAQTLILDEPTAVLTPQETEKLFEQHNAQIQEYIRNKTINVVERIAVNYATIYSFRQTEEKDIVDVALKATKRDYIIDEKTGNVVQGNKNQDRITVYKMTFERTKGTLTAKGEEKLDTKNCPNCGAPLKFTSSGKCEYCGSIVTTGAYDWVLSAFTAIK